MKELQDIREKLLPLQPKELFYKEYRQVRQDPELLQAYINSFPEGYLCQIGGWIPEYTDTHTMEYIFEQPEIFKSNGDDVDVLVHTRYSPALRHEHSFFEMMYVLCGSCLNEFDDVCLHMQEGDICIISPHHHHYVDVADDNSILINIVIRTSTFNVTFAEFLAEENVLSDFFIRTLYMNYANAYILFHTKGDALLHGQLELLIREQFDHDTYTKTLKKQLLLSAFGYLLRHHADKTEISNTVNTRLMVVSQILRYLQEHYRTATLPEVAAHFNYTAPYLSSIVKEATKRTFSDILQDIRIKQACNLLNTTNYTAKEISMHVGYCNIEHFHRVFKKVTGTTPGKYRNTEPYF